MLSRRDFIKNLAACSAGCLLGGGISSCASGKPDSRVAAARTGHSTTESGQLKSKQAGSQGKLSSEPVKEAWFYRKSASGEVLCLLCPRQCTLKKGMRGICRVRENRDGTLYTLVYGRVASSHTDPIEKKPFYHFLPGNNAYSLATAGCNLQCLFCQNWEISQVAPERVVSEYMPPGDLVNQARKDRAPIIAFTYTEPTVFSEYVFETAQAAGKSGIKSVIVSSGYINPAPIKKLCPVLDGVKIDLKSFSDRFYREFTGGRLRPVLKAMETIKASGTWLEIVNLVIPGRNDRPGDIRNMARWIRTNLGDTVPLHFTRFTPMYRLVNVPPTPVKTLEQCRDIALEEGLKFVYVGNIPGHPGNHTYCPKCRRIVIRREGFRVDMTGLKKGTCVACKTPIPGVFS